MASLRSLDSLTAKYRRLQIVAEAKTRPIHEHLPKHVAVSKPISRRCSVLIFSLPFSLISLPRVAESRERRNKKTIPLEDYLTSPANGLKYYDVLEGKGPVAEKGSTVQVHFDCIYRGITAVSSRESKLLAGNRIIAQPYEFKVGSPPGKERKRDFVDNPNGLFSAQAAPKPPPAMYSVTEGMRVGGKVMAFLKFLSISLDYNNLVALPVSVFFLFSKTEDCYCASRSWLWSKGNERDSTRKFI
ncbi:hypothetical protein K2173_027970 [Erythroxylum novogranatense]|uniref:Peptidylprolyl isomerase n=1 Tax=Erythroxylum novogranatense TaxID=1862640 RepID=A0AAV8U357_9ROSI|nr:hypothetical protein K2173_027970 [Erythroxylum novogranatense]